MFNYQNLNKESYSKIIPYLIKNVKLWRTKSLFLNLDGQSFLNELSVSNDLEWKPRDIRAYDQENNFIENFQFAELWSKVVQVNKELIYMIGGNVEHRFSTDRCYSFNLQANELRQIQSLKQKRYGHGLCYMNQFLYVVGGVQDDNQTLDVCERYDIINKEWNEIPKLEVPCFSMTLLSVRGRYIYTIGGIYGPYQLFEAKEMIHRLDVQKLNQTPLDCQWESFQIESMLPQACQYGLIPLPFNSDQEKNINQYLIFGGVSYLDSLQRQIMIFKENTQDFSKSKFELLPNFMEQFDRFYFNQNFEISASYVVQRYPQELGKLNMSAEEFIYEFGLEGDLIGIMGRNAFHVLSRKQKRFIVHDKEGGYVNLLDKSKFNHAFSSQSADEEQEEEEDLYESEDININQQNL
eukprot:403369692